MTSLQFSLSANISIYSSILIALPGFNIESFSNDWQISYPVCYCSYQIVAKSQDYEPNQAAVFAESQSGCALVQGQSAQVEEDRSRFQPLKVHHRGKKKAHSSIGKVAKYQL